MNPQQFLTTVEDTATARRVFGEPIETDGLTLIPAAVLRGGGGAGSRGGDGGGGGFGLTARPAGVFAIGNGDVRWRPALDVNRVIMGGQFVAIAAILTFGPLLKHWLSHR